VDDILRLARSAESAAALWVLAVSLTLALTAFDRMPRLPDEVAPICFRRRCIAAGHLVLPAPGGAMNAALAYDWISIEGGKWFSIFPPGWPTVLALGMATGVPFIVNPLLAALGILLSHRFVTRIVSPRLAALVTLLLCVSPWYLATGASLMSHPLTLVLVLGAWLLLLKDNGAMAALLVRRGAADGRTVPHPAAGGRVRRRRNRLMGLAARRPEIHVRLDRGGGSMAWAAS
jgi:hypothetical protein